MPVKSASRDGKRRTHFNECRVKSLLKSARADLRSVFHSAKPAEHREARQKDTPANRGPNVVSDDLFQGASTILDVARLSQARSVPQLSEKSASRPLRARYVIRSRTNHAVQPNDLSDASASKPQRLSKKLSEISASSLAQPSVYFAPPCQPSCQRAEEHHATELTTPAALPGDHKDDDLAVQPTNPSPESRPEHAAVARASDFDLYPTKQGPFHLPEPRASEEIEAQISGSSPHENDSTNQFLSPMVSSRHLASGASSNDTFAFWKQPKSENAGAKSISFGGLEGLSDPFLPLRPENESLGTTVHVTAAHSNTQVQKITDAETMIAAENRTPKSPARWSDDYDQFSSDGQNRRLTEIAPGQYELLDRGYHLKAPPVLTTRIPRVRQLIADDSSDEGEATAAQPEPFIRERQRPLQEHIHPQPIPVMVPLATVIENTQSAVNYLTEQLNDLVFQAQTHFWNAGVFAGRVATRDQELATAQQNVVERDVEIERLRDLLDTRETGIEPLRARKSSDEHPTPFGRGYGDECETSDLYGGSSYRVGGEGGDEDPAVDIVETSFLHEYQETNGDQRSEPDDEDEVLLSPATDTRRYRFVQLETASNGALPGLHEFPSPPRYIQPHSA